MPEGEVSGTINVEVIYKEAGGAGIGAGAPSAGLGEASGAEAASDTKKRASQMFDVTKYLKVMAGAVTVGAVIKQSKIMSGFLSSTVQIFGAMIDIFLMPFIPILVPLMKAMSGLVKWFMGFMKDPIGALQEAFMNIINLSKDIIVGIFTGWGDFDFGEFFGGIDFKGILETTLKVGMGAIGLVGLFTAITGAQALTQLFGKGTLMTATFIGDKLFGAGEAILKTSMEAFLGIGRALPMRRLLPIVGTAGLIVGLIAAEHLLNNDSSVDDSSSTKEGYQWQFDGGDDISSGAGANLYQSSEARGVLTDANSNLSSSIFSGGNGLLSDRWGFGNSYTNTIPNINLIIKEHEIDVQKGLDEAYKEAQRLIALNDHNRYKYEDEG